MQISFSTSGSDFWGRYYTKSDISFFLIAQIEISSPSRLVDLGAGSGSLCAAAQLRWPQVEVLTVDIDPCAAIKIAKTDSVNFKPHKHFTADALLDNLPELLDSHSSPIDIAVCNPPFITPKWKEEYRDILRDAGFEDCLPFPSDVDAGLLFLAQNLRLLSRNATLAIILPDSLITSRKYLKFRSQLLTRYTVSKIIQLPRGAFHGTDALASIMILQKDCILNRNLCIYSLDENKNLSKPVSVDIESAIERLDYNYHLYKSEHPPTGKVRLDEITLELKRGSRSSAQVKISKFPIFHLTDIKIGDLGRWIDLSSFSEESTDYKGTYAQPGDILIARVGRNLENKIIGVMAGTFPVSDCVYVLRCNENYRTETLRQLSSTHGRSWLSAHSHGVAAKQITKKQLLQFPLDISNKEVQWNLKKEPTS